MSRLTIDLIGGEAVLASFENESCGRLELVFLKESVGYVRISGLSAALKSDRAIFDLKLISDGTLYPELIRDGRVTRLPPIKKQGYLIEPISPTHESYHGLILRERALSERVERLERQIGELNSRVFGEPIFEFPLTKNIQERNKK